MLSFWENELVMMVHSINCFGLLPEIMNIISLQYTVHSEFSLTGNVDVGDAIH